MPTWYHTVKLLFANSVHHFSLLKMCHGWSKHFTSRYDPSTPNPLHQHHPTSPPWRTNREVPVIVTVAPHKSVASYARADHIDRHTERFNTVVFSSKSVHYWGREVQNTIFVARFCLGVRLRHVRAPPAQPKISSLRNIVTSYYWRSRYALYTFNLSLSFDAPTSSIICKWTLKQPEMHGPPGGTKSYHTPSCWDICKGR